MSKVVLYYFDGRGKAEAIRWMLAATNTKFEEIFLKTRKDYLQMIKDGLFLYEQVPMLEIDGMKLCQTGAILRYLARKGGMYGSDAKQQALIDMYYGGIEDMSLTALTVAFQPKESRDEFFQKGKEKIIRRYFPIFEEALTRSKTSYLANTDTHSMADVVLIMVLLSYVEIEETILDAFPTLKNWLEAQKKIPWIENFLAPGSKRKPAPDDVYVRTVNEVFGR